MTQHVTQNIQARRPSANGDHIVRHQGYSQTIDARKRIEQVFGWSKRAAATGSSRQEDNIALRRCSGYMWWPTT
jgi:hypothetical protein